ncbi:MAG TPA: hypothetical protein VFA11_12385 [Acidimicrobiales bacterium]|nr:hypothetical protein [Acidimicrobiales bacterium]
MSSTVRSIGPGVETPTRGGAISLFSLLGWSAVAWTAAAGVVHFVATTLPDHHADPLLLSFFLGAGVAQLTWALAVARRPTPALLVGGAAMNLAIAAIWVVSRTVGIPFVNGGSPEAVGFADVASTLLEVAAAASLSLAAALPAEAGRSVLRRGSLLLAGAVGGAVGMLLPAVISLPSEMASGHQMPAPAAMASARAESPPGMAGLTSMAGMSPAVRALGQPISLAMAVMSPHSSATMTMTAPGPGAQPSMPGAMNMGTPAGSGGTAGTSDPKMTFWGQRSVVRYGPIPLPPASMGGGLHDLVSPAFPKPCDNCLMTGVIPDMVYADGSPANIDTGVMLHHIVLFDNSKDDYTCPRWDGVGVLGRRIFASGNERTAFSLPAGFGLPVGTQQWAGLFDLMNMTAQVRNVYLQFTVYHVPATSPGIRQVVPVWLDENNCSNSEFSVPAGRSDTTWTWTSSLTGRVVLAGGHLHDGGVSITLTDTTRGERICTAVAGYGTKPHYQGNIDSMQPVCRWDRLAVVTAGDSLRLDALYNPPHPESGVMGIMLIDIYPTNDLNGGSPPPPGANGPADGPSSPQGGGMQGMS